MHKHLTPSERTNMLADYIEARHNEHFDMSNADHCAYAFAKRMFGVEHLDLGGTTNKAMLADMLHIPYEEAVSLYCSTSLNREETVEYIRVLARRVEDAQYALLSPAARVERELA